METRVDGFIFYASYYDGICELSEEEQGRLYIAIMKYVFEGIDPDLTGGPMMAFKFMKPTIDANIKRRINGKKGAEYGKLGGRPKGNKTPKETPSKTPIETPTQTPSKTPKDNKKENIKENIKDKEEYKEEAAASAAIAEEVRPQDVVDLYNKICISLPKAKVLTDERRKHIKARLNENDPGMFLKVFQIVEASDFLSGRSGKWQSCNFDWIVGSPTHWARILEGTYDNKEKPSALDAADRVSDALIGSADPEAVAEFERSMNGGYTA